MNYFIIKHAIENRAFSRCWQWQVLLTPQKDCAQTKRKWHHAWCEDDTCTLGWGVGMH